jgi:nitrogen-specific signal transduction histidine kinase
MTIKELMTVLEAIPDPTMVLNNTKRIVMVNGRMTQSFAGEKSRSLIGMRPGEAIGCIYQDEAGECGTTPDCAACTLNESVSVSRSGATPVSRQGGISLKRRHGTYLDVEITATPLDIVGASFTICVVKEVKLERHSMLGKVFLHDMNNILTAIHGYAQLLVKGDGECREKAAVFHRMLLQQIERLLEEVAGQRRILAAEAGDFAPQLGPVCLPEVVREVQSLLSAQAASLGCRLEVLPGPETGMISDRLALRRVLLNLTKNAIEATEPGGTVTLQLTEHSGAVCFLVHNPGVMTHEVQQNLFRYSFSTKSPAGRGLGAYSIKLFGEGVLGGKVAFTSSEPHGTTFTLQLPKKEKLQQAPVTLAGPGLSGPARAAYLPLNAAHHLQQKRALPQGEGRGKDGVKRGEAPEPRVMSTRQAAL